MYELNDDMDELFRRAAKDYPLDTGSADWNKLQEAILKADTTAGGSDMSGSVKRSKRRFLWLLLLLLPIPWICHEYSGNGNDNKTELTQTENTGKTVATTEKTGNSNMIERQETAPPVTTDNKALLKQENMEPGSYMKTDRHNYFLSRANKQVKYGSTASNKIKDENKQIQNVTKDNAYIQPAESPSFPSEPRTAAGKEEIKNADSAVEKTAVEKKKPLQESKTDSTIAKKTAKKNSKTKGLYIGVVGGPDLSSVKLQAIKNVGLNGGVIIGYQWNKRFSVENGVAWNKKYYYSKGQYFSTEKIYLPPNTKIGNVTGDCNMIEWAINLRYNLKTGPATTWSAVAGVSSYFMKKEDYDYQYVYTNGQTDARYRTYNNASNNWLSVINLGLTYSHKLGRTGSFRIEPYIKLPVKGLGIGSLPIMSSGLNVGFIKKIF